MATCPTIEVIDLASKQQVVINEADFDSSAYKRVSKSNENAPRATIAEVSGEDVNPSPRVVGAAKKRKLRG
jgi:hypothetical protein